MGKVTKTSKKKSVLRLFFVCVILVGVCVGVYFILKATNVWEKINSIEKIKKIVQSGGVFSFLIFMLLQILQTTVLQIPAFLLTVSGALIFGRWKAFILSYVAVMIGSIIMFWIGRKAGRKFLNWMIGKEKSEVWIDKMTHGKYLFFLMMIFPLFPDDILCVVAGLTNMSFKFFFITNIIARAMGIGCTVFFGSGAVIPFHGWGLAVWAVIFIIIGVLFYFSVRFQDKLDLILQQFKIKQANKQKKDKIKARKINK